MKFSIWFAASRSTGRAPRRRPALELLEDRLAPAAYVVNRLGDAGSGVGLKGDIRYVIDQINASGDTSDSIRFALKPRAIVRLTHGQLMINGGENVTMTGRGVGGVVLSANRGNRSSRILFVTGGATVAVKGVTFSGGDGSEGFDTALGSFGGNIANFGTLTLTSSIVRFGTAGGTDGEGGSAQGGGIYNIGTLTLIGSRVTSNLARGSAGGDGLELGLSGGEGGEAAGGGVYSPGTLTLTNTLFADNKAIGGDGGDGSAGGDGMDALPESSETGMAGDSGGDGGAAGAAFGGAVYYSNPSELKITGGSFVTNQAISGRGGDGGDGGNGGDGNDTVAGGVGGDGGEGGAAASARGGALAVVNSPEGPALESVVSAGVLTVVGTAFTRNFVQSSASGKGGNGGDGGAGAAGGDGGGAAGCGCSGVADAWGGAVALANVGDQSFTRATFTGNRVAVTHDTSAGNAGNGGNAGPSGDAGDGGFGGNVLGAEGGNNAWGGAIGAENSGSLTIDQSKFSFNLAYTTRAGNGGVAGGIGGQGDGDGQDGAGGFGGFGGETGAAVGGAIGRETFSEGDSSLTVRDSLFRGNQAIGGQAGDGGNGGTGEDGGDGGHGRSGAGAVGGAVADLRFGPTTGSNTFERTRFLGNSALAGNGGKGGVGGTATSGTAGAGGRGGDAFGAGGGAVFEQLGDFVDFSDSTFSNNLVRGGIGGAGGAGGTAPETGAGGDGGEGGRASFVSGGAVNVTGAEGVSFTNTTITGNIAQGSIAGVGGAGGQGGLAGRGGDGGLGGDVDGGGVTTEIPGAVEFEASDLTSNRALGSSGGMGGSGGRSLAGPGGLGGAGGDAGGTFGGGLSSFGFGLGLMLDNVNVANNQAIGGRAGDGGAGGA